MLPTQLDCDMDTQSDYDALSQPIPKAKNFLQGTLTKIKANASFTTITIHLTERITKEEYIPSQSTSSKPITKNGNQGGNGYGKDREEHLIKLHGTWCQFLTEDLKITLNLKLYLDCYSPEHDLKENCWEFRDGLRADLFIHNPAHHPQRDPSEPKLFRKKVDLGPITLEELNGTQLYGCDEEGKDEPTDFKDLGTVQQNTRPNHPASRSKSVKHKIKHEESLDEKEELTSSISADQPNPHKRICTNPASDATAEHTSDLCASNQNLHSVNPPPLPCTSFKPDSNPVGRSASQVPSSLQHASGDRQTQIAENVIQPSKESRFWKTLDEVDKLVGGAGQKFNVMGIISSKKSEISEKSVGGTLDYRMTLYLTDYSRPEGHRDITCNLFSKSERDAPPWLTAEWAVIMLFNVYKRRSDIYHTQIVGAASSFDWAVWCPGYLGSAERLETSFLIKTNKNHESSNKYNVTEVELKKLARELYQRHLQESDPSDIPAQSLIDFGQANESIAKDISELRHGIRHKVDLCVKIVDVWIDSPNKDRVTVTDYTANPLLRAPKPRSLMEDVMNSDMPDEPVTPILQFHQENGGNDKNWRATEKRLMTIYIGQPILEVLYHKLQGHDSSERMTKPSPYDIKAVLTNKFFKFSQVEICVRAGSSNNGIFYGLLDNPLKDFELDQGTLPNVANLDNHTFDLLASKIVRLKPSDPPYRKILRAQETFQLELQQHSSA